MSKSNIANKNGSKDLIKKLKGIKGDTFRLELARVWLNKKENKLESEDLEELMKFFELDSYKLKFAEAWLSKEENNLNFDNFKKFLGSPKVDDGKSVLAKVWISKEVNNLDFEGLKELLGLFETSKYYDFELKNKVELVKKWLSKEGNNLRFEDFKELSGLFKFNSSKLELVTFWFNKERSNLKFENLKELIGLFDNDTFKIDFIKTWLSKEGDNFEFANLKEFLELFKDDYSKIELTKAWLSKQENNFNLEILKELLGLFSIHNKSRLAKVWLSKEPDLEKRYTNLKAIIQSKLVFDIYDYNVDTIYKITDMCEGIVNTKDLTRLCVDLYPNNQFIQSELLQEFIHRRLFEKKDLGLIKDFLNEITDSDIALTIVKESRTKLSLSEKEILDLCSGRISRLYSSIADLLKDKPLDEYLKPDSLNFLAESLNLDVNSPEFKAITLEALFSYHTIMRKEAEFTSMIIPEKLEEIRLAFKLPEKTLYISEAEYIGLQSILDDQMPSLVRMEVLCDYLKTKVGKTPEVTEQNIKGYKIQFPKDLPLIETIQKEEIKGKEETAEEKEKAEKEKAEKEKAEKEKAERERIKREKEQEELNERFKMMIMRPDLENPSKEEIARFNDEIALFMFEVIGRKDGFIVISSDSKEKIAAYFKANKNDLAYFLSTPNGIEHLSLLINSAGDGCVANFATKIKECVNQSIIKNGGDRLLNLIFQEKIATPIFNSGGDHLGGSPIGANSFNNPSITTSFLSPRALVAKTFEMVSEKINNDYEGYKETLKIIEKEIIDKNNTKAVTKDNGTLQDGILMKVIDKISSDLDCDSTQIFAFLATYLVLRPLTDKIPKLANEISELFGRIIDKDALKELDDITKLENLDKLFIVDNIPSTRVTSAQVDHVNNNEIQSYGGQLG